MKESKYVYMVLRIALMSLLIGIVLSGLPTSASVETDQGKQQEILSMVENHRASFPAELILSIIRQEGGAGAFHIDGWNYNDFYRETDGSWAQPTNGDGVMQVTVASGYHERSGLYTHTRDGYDHAINDGCDYLVENPYGSYVQSTLHYNTGPYSLYVYLGLDAADRNYLSNTAQHLTGFVPATYGIRNDSLAHMLNEGQAIVDDYLYNRGIAAGQPLEYYEPYQTQLDSDLLNIQADEEGEGCFIATAACGPQDNSVQILREFRDSYMESNRVGARLVSAYYKLSPPLAGFIDDHPALKPAVRVGLLPAVGISEAAVSMTLSVKVAIVAALVVVCALVAVWLRMPARRKERIPCQSRWSNSSAGGEPR